jgi:hypothetical protein
LFFYRDEARNGTFGWSSNGIGQKIGNGWANFWTIFSGGNGIVYAITSAGDLLYYRDEGRNGTFSWSFNGTGQKIGSGWTAPPLEGYCWPLSAAARETIEFKVSSPSAFQVSYLRLKPQTSGDLDVAMAAPQSFGPTLPI